MLCTFGFQLKTVVVSAGLASNLPAYVLFQILSDNAKRVTVESLLLVKIASVALRLASAKTINLHDNDYHLHFRIKFVDYY